jgi:hypothetical protein
LASKMQVRASCLPSWKAVLDKAVALLALALKLDKVGP